MTIDFTSIMKRIPYLPTVILSLGFLIGCAEIPKHAPSESQTKTPGARLAAPTAESERAYLGLPANAADFSLVDIECEVLVIDHFDMYCHICQEEAHQINKLYQLVQERGLGGRFKFIGLGLGDTLFEANTFKKQFKVPFPVFPDRKLGISKQFGQARLPSLVALRKRGDQFEIIVRSVGIPKPMEEFLNIILAGGQHTARTTGLSFPTCGDNDAVCKAASLTRSSD